MERQHPKQEEEDKKLKLEGLPVKTSPYTQYKDLEDYKEQGYGTHGHLKPETTGRGAAASTDAPTSAGLPSQSQSQSNNSKTTGDPVAVTVTATDTVNEHGVP